MNHIKRIFPIFSSLLTILTFTVLASVTDLNAATIASLRSVTGQVDVLVSGQLPARPAKDGDQVSSGDLVRTKTGGTAEVIYHDGTVLRIAQRSRIDIGEHFSGASPNSSEVKLARGKVQAVVNLNDIKAAPGAKKFEIRTANAIAGVRGTDFIVAHDKAMTSVLVNSGEVYVYNILKAGEMVNLTPGMITTVYGRNKPAPPRPAADSDTRKMQGSGTQKSGGAAAGAASDATAMVGDTPQAVAGPSIGTLDGQLMKAATQGVSGAVASPPPLPPPPPPVAPKSGSVTATWL